LCIVCGLYTPPCASNTRELSPATLTSDRVCSDVIPVCNSSFYNANYQPSNPGQLTCLPVATCTRFCTAGSLDCRCSANCFTCLYNQGTDLSYCTLCSTGQFLHDGQCLSSCPMGFTGTGASTIGRRCLPSSPSVAVPVPSLSLEYQQAEPTQTSNRMCAVRPSLGYMCIGCKIVAYVCCCSR
jgi:hypothetical protein